MTRFLALAVLALSVTVSAMPSASAQVVETAPIDQIKADAGAAIEQRLDTLEALAATVEGTSQLTGPHAEQLLSDIRSASVGLRDLGAAIQSADSLGAVLRLVPTIATDFRIYLVLGPKTFEVIGSDVVVAVANQMVVIESAIDAAIQAISAAGFETGGVQATLDAAVEHRVSAHDLAVAVAPTVVGLEAADWPDLASALLESGRESLIEAHHEAVAAAKGYQQTIRELHRLIRS